MQVQQVYSVIITLPLTLAAANLTAAEAQAERITAGSSGLATALAAGLIAGQPSCPSTCSTVIAYERVLASVSTTWSWTALNSSVLHLNNLCAEVLKMRVSDMNLGMYAEVPKTWHIVSPVLNQSIWRCRLP